MKLTNERAKEIFDALEVAGEIIKKLLPLQEAYCAPLNKGGLEDLRKITDAIDLGHEIFNFNDEAKECPDFGYERQRDTKLETA